MYTFTQKQYLLTCSNLALTIDQLKYEFDRLVDSSSVQSELADYGMTSEQLGKLQIQFNVEEQPALSPEEILTLGITIMILEPTGKVVEKVLTDVWERVLYPRLLTWVDSKGWNLNPKLSSEPIKRKEQINMLSRIESINPMTGERIETFEATSKAEVHSTISKCRKSFSDWRGTSLDDRLQLFKELATAIEEDTDDLQNLILNETGKRIPDAEYEVYDIVDGIEHYGQQMRRITLDDGTIPLSFLPHGTKFDTIPELRYEPHGVAAVIMPWNFPFWIPMVNIIPALMAGNTVVFKPSEYSTLVGQKIVQLFRRAGFPEGVLEMVVGDEKVGKEMVKGDVDLIFLTGSVQAGLDVRRNAGLKPVELELGGNSASIVCEDADLELAVEGTVWGALYNAGQSCSGLKRVFVHKNVADEFKAKVLKKVDSLQPARDYGPYIRYSAMQTVQNRIRDAVNHGAKVLYSNNLKGLPDEYKDGYWLAPTVLEYKNDNIELVTQETFGNVLPIRIVESTEEAILLANSTDYGLTNVLWTQDLEKGQELARQLQSGMVFINEAEISLVAGEYWRGWKNSSIGGVGSKIEKCLKQQLLITYTSSKPREYWFPYK